MSGKTSESERLVLCASTHWMKYYSKVLFCLFLLVLGSILVGVSFVLQNFILSVAALIFLVGFALVLFSQQYFFHMLISEAMEDIVVTTDRILYFDDCLFVCDDEHEIPLHKVAAVEVKQHGVLQNVLDYGVLWFDTGGGAIDLKRSIPYVPHPDRVAEKITVLLRKHSS